MKISTVSPWLTAIFVASRVVLAADPAMESLSALGLLNRCYSHFTRQKISKDHPLRAAVLSGRQTPQAACLSLLDKATLIASGPKEGYLPDRDAEAKATLATFNLFHRTWFPNDDIVQASACGDFCPREGQIYDSGESALHLTRALFAPGIAYAEIFRGASSLEALRTNGAKANVDTIPPLATPVSPGAVERRPIDTELVQTGELIGIRRMELNSKKHDTVVFGNMNAPVNSPGALFPNHSLGGGILGTKSYLFLNFGRDFYEKADGGLVMPRRWVKAIFSDLLCRELPVLRASDAVAYVAPSSTSATPPFRTAQNCMACHATMDPAAATARNLSGVSLPVLVEGESPLYVSGHLQSWTPALPRELGMVEKDPQFYLRPPFGRLFFRSYDGKLVHQEVEGIAGLGEAIAQTDDAYVCAASRYFKYFTGVSVNLFDAGDPASGTLSAGDKKYFDEVVRLGLGLKSHQSLRTLISEILQSEIYRRKSQRFVEALP